MPTGPVSNFHASGVDPDALSQEVSRPTWTVQYQPLTPASGFKHEINISTTGSLIALRSVSTHGFKANVQMSIRDRFELHFVEKGQYRCGTLKDGVTATAHRVYLLRDVHEHHVEAVSDTQQLCISIPIERCARLLAVDTDDPWKEMAKLQPMADFAHGKLKVLHDLAGLLVTGGSGEHHFAETPLTASLIEEAFIGAFVEAWPGTTPVKAPTKLPPNYIKHAVEWIEAHPSSRVRLEDLALVAGVSVRTLQVGFKRELGISPLGYVIKTRLQLAHRDLLALGPDVSVEEIAQRWGFTHMGDFSARHRKFFGATPSEIRRANRR